MQVEKLDCKTAEVFIKQRLAAAILYYYPNDPSTRRLLRELTEVAATFHDHVIFGNVDLSAPENEKLVSSGLIVMSPTLVLYRFKEVAWQIYGVEEVSSALTHKSIVHYVGYSTTYLKLFD